MAVTRDFIVKLMLDQKDLIKGFSQMSDKAKGIFGGAEAEMQKIVPSIVAVTAASAAAFAGIAAFATKATQAAIEDQVEQEKLAQTLRNVVGATDEAVASTEKFIAGLAKTTTFSDSQLRPALSSLAVATGDLAEAQNLLTTAQDISVATGTDLQQVSDALAKASNGNMKALQALSPTLRDNIKEGQSFSQVLEELNANFGGAAQAAAGTLGGQMTILRNRFDEIVESIGTAFLPIVQIMASVLGTVATIIENNTTLFTFLIVAIGTMAGQITLLVAAITAYKAVMALASAANILFGATLTATGIGAIIVLVGVLIGAFVALIAKTGGITNAFKTMANFVIGAFENMVNNAIGAINFLIDKVNVVIRGMQKVGISVEEIAPIAEVTFARFNTAVKSTEGPITSFIGNAVRASGALNMFTIRQQLESRARAESIGWLNKWNTAANAAARTTGGAAEKTKTATEKLKEYTNVLKSAQSASKSFGDAQKRVGKAQESVADADQAVADAQAALARAQQGGSPEQIAAAQRALAGAERGLARAKFGQEESIMAVRDAERKLAEVRGNVESSPDEIRRAEIALAEAKFAVADAEDNQIKVTEELTEARRQLRIASEGLREGDAELEPLQQAISKAMLDSKNAAEGLDEAMSNLGESTTTYSEALQELGRVAEMFPKIAARVGGPGLLPLTGPSVPQPSPSNPYAFGANEMQMNVNVNVGSGIVNSQQVGQEIAEYLRDFTRLNGPLSNFVAV